eukprot:jgi/Galph1/2861/GphlegSOOS_G1495.1
MASSSSRSLFLSSLDSLGVKPHKKVVLNVGNWLSVTARQVLCNKFVQRGRFSRKGRVQSFQLNYLRCCSREESHRPVVVRKAFLFFASVVLGGSVFPVVPSSSPNLFPPALATANDHAKIGKKKARELFKERTKDMRVYIVANQAGQPFLAEGIEPGTQVGLIFFSMADASMMLMQMSQGAGGDARIESISLDKAYEMVSAKPTSSGLKDSKGRSLKVVFRFCPEVGQIKFYKRLAKADIPYGVPVFVVPDLSLEKEGENLIPVFLDKEDVDKCWQELKKSHPELPLRPRVETADLLDILKKMEDGSNPDIYQLGFYSPRKNLVWAQRNSDTEQNKQT